MVSSGIEGRNPKIVVLVIIQVQMHRVNVWILLRKLTSYVTINLLFESGQTQMNTQTQQRFHLQIDNALFALWF